MKTSKEVCTGVVKTNSDKGVFPLKIREAMILEANNFGRGAFSRRTTTMTTTIWSSATTISHPKSLG